MNTTTTTLRLDKEIKSQLDMHALKQNRSLNNLITTILIQWLEQQKKEAEASK